MKKKDTEHFLYVMQKELELLMVLILKKYKVNNMNIKCSHCGSVNKAAKWNESTESYYGIGGVPIEEGIYNNNWIYRCPECDRECFKNDRTEQEE